MTVPSTPPAPGAAPASRALPVLALVFNAMTWGLSWWPFRWLNDRGLHPLWATALIFAAAVLAITAWRPRAWITLARNPGLWWLMLGAGTTNAAFNWGVTVGDVVRVVLLFYLMPLWSAFLARWLLKERLGVGDALRIAMALAGAVAVLLPPGGLAGGMPLPRDLAEWLGVVGGFSFALNNVLLKRESASPGEARALAMFVGAGVVAAALAAAVGPGHGVPWPPAPSPHWLAAVGVLACCFVGSNLALQYGAARLPANVTAVVMITEVLFASASALALGAGTLTPALMAGGVLILGATLLAARAGR